MGRNKKTEPFNIDKSIVLAKYSYGILKRKLYDKIPKEDLYSLRPLHRYTPEELMELEKQRKDFIKYFERIKARKYMVSLEEILIELFDHYYVFYLDYDFPVRYTLKKQVEVVFKRLKRLYRILKDYEFEIGRLINYREHRKWRVTKIVASSRKLCATNNNRKLTEENAKLKKEIEKLRAMMARKG